MVAKINTFSIKTYASKMNLCEVMCTRFLMGEKHSNTAGMNLEALLDLQSKVPMWQSALSFQCVLMNCP